MHRFSGPEHELVVEHLDTVGPDGGHTHSLLVRAPADARAPVLMWVHGGPISAWGDGWHWRWCVAAAVAAGFAVCLPNPRGSTGYGQGWVDGVWGNTWGGACFDDTRRSTASAS
jgi:dipeptidyl aminopeptidase/acylaminoacyl peptidase